MKNVRRSTWLLRGEVGSGAIAEFGPAMLIFVVIVLLPLIGMLTLADGVGTLYFATAQAARAAGPSNSSTEAVSNMRNMAKAIIGGPLGAFARIDPANESGMSIKILRLAVNGSTVEPFGPLLPLPSASWIDTGKYFYEYQVTATGYTVSPLFWPGRAVPFTFTSSCTVEHPEGLSQ